MNSIFGIITEVPGYIRVNNFGSSSLTVDGWIEMIRLVAYKMVDVKLEVAGTCDSYVGSYTRTFNFQAYDENGDAASSILLLLLK